MIITPTQNASVPTVERLVAKIADAEEATLQEGKILWAAREVAQGRGLAEFMTVEERFEMIEKLLTQGVDAQVMARMSLTMAKTLVNRVA